MTWAKQTNIMGPVGPNGGIEEAPADSLPYARQNLSWIRSVTYSEFSTSLALKLDASAYTAADVLAKIKTVDGTGSGLDADTLDGHDTAFFATQTALDAETSTRSSADSTLTTNLASEASTRATADTALQTAINNEASARTAADNTLQNNIDLKANTASPVFTGDPQAPTPATADNDQSIATTAFVKAQGYAPIASPTFTGDPKAPTPATGDSDTSIATTAFVKAQAYLTDAPSDGLTYGRKNAAWSTIVGGAVVSDMAPPGPLQAGQLWWESDTGNLYLYYTDANSSQWVQVPGAAGAKAVVSDTPPSPAYSGDIWYESDTGNFYVYVDDGNSQQWVAVNVNSASQPDYIASSPVDMWAGFRTTKTFVVNDNVSGTGRDAFRFTATSGDSIQTLDKLASGNASVIYGRTGTLPRWALVLGEGTAESGSGTTSAGSQFAIHRYQNDGTYWNTPVLIGRANSGGAEFGTTWNAGKPLLTLDTNIRAPVGATFTDDAGSMSITTPNTGGLTHFVYDGPGANVGIAIRNIVGGSATPVYVIYYTTAVGSITCSSSATAFNTTSDERFKVDMRDAGSSARTMVDALRVVEFTPLEPVDPPKGHVPFKESFKARGAVEPPADPTMFGIPAQQAYTVYPVAVSPPDEQMPGYEKDAVPGDAGFHPWMVDYSKFVPMLLANIQELNKRVDELQAKLEAAGGV